MKQPELSLFDLPDSDAAKLRDEGIKRSADRAERESPGWQNRAISFIQNYPEETFMAEDVRPFAYENGLDKPSNEKCWGGVFTRAKNEKMIVAIGLQLTRKAVSHKRPQTLWRKV